MRVLGTLDDVLMQTIYGPIQMVLVIGMTRIGLVHHRVITSTRGG